MSKLQLPEDSPYKTFIEFFFPFVSVTINTVQLLQGWRRCCQCTLHIHLNANLHANNHLEERGKKRERMCLAEDKARRIIESMNRVSVEGYTIKASSARKWNHINDSPKDFSIDSYSIVVCKHDSQQVKQNEWNWKKFTHVSSGSQRSNWLYRPGPPWSIPKISTVNKYFHFLQKSKIWNQTIHCPNDSSLK